MECLDDLVHQETLVREVHLELKAKLDLLVNKAPQASQEKEVTQDRVVYPECRESMESMGMLDVLEGQAMMEFLEKTVYLALQGRMGKRVQLG